MTENRAVGGNPRSPTSELGRYFLASLVALAIDLWIFSLSMRFGGLTWVSAAALGFFAGAIVAYWLSIRFVFRNRVLRDSPGIEFLGFAVIGIAGLGVTEITLWLGIELLDVVPEVGKLAAAAVTFIFNFALRKLLLFRRRRLLSQEGSP